jgi:DASS family divalent anion:Na+ symporter
MQRVLDTNVQRTDTKRYWWRWAVTLIPGALLFFLPFPGLNTQQARILGVFVSTIIALVAQPVRMGVVAFLAMTVLALTRTLPPAKVLSGFSNVTIWLIFTAFLFSRAVTATGFGMRVGYAFIQRFARNPLAVGYSIAAADLVLAPFIPSDTARGGGIVFPITRSVASAFGSEPGPTSKRIGAFLVLVSFHATYTASAMFLTGMAANPLIADFARQRANVELTWMRWFSGASVPGLLTLILVPLLIYRWMTPEIRDTEPARELARKELARLGPPSKSERWLMVIMFGVMGGWITSTWHGIPNTFVALAGLSAILLTNVLSWDDILAEHRAWDALIWFASMLMMAEALNEVGVIKIF